MTLALPDLVSSTLSSFEDVRSKLAAHPSFKRKPELLSPWDDELGRMRLWISNIGAHQRGQSSLEFRLRDASHIQNQKVQLLEDICDALEESRDILDQLESSETSGNHEETSQDDIQAELQQLHENIVTFVRCLYQMSLLVRKPAKHDFMKSRLSEEVLAFRPFYEQHLRDKFPKAPTEIIERLTVGMMRRLEYLRYRERHRAKLGRGLSGEGATEQAEALSETVVSGPMPEDEIKSETDVSQTSYASTILPGASSTMPPVPREADDKRPFECPYCYVLISIDGTRSWHKHILEDLQPYICVVPGCKTPSAIYSARHKWIRHLEEEHPHSWFRDDDVMESDASCTQSLFARRI